MMDLRRVMGWGWGFRRRGLVVGAAFAGALILTQEGSSQTPAESQGSAEEEAVVVEEWVGRWSGPFESDGPVGTLILIVVYNGEEWRVTSELVDDGAPPAGPVLGWAVRGVQFSYVQWYDDIELSVRGRLVEGELVGDMEATREGEQVGVATFRLSPDAPATPSVEAP